MGVTYSILPVDEQTRNWLSELGVRISGIHSRNPLIGEIYDSLNKLYGYSYEADEFIVGKSWDAQIHDGNPSPIEWTRMTILNCRPPSEPQELHFSKGAPSLIIRVVCSLANRCGPLVVSADGEDAFLIASSSDPKTTYTKWLRTQNTQSELGDVGDGSHPAYT